MTEPNNVWMVRAGNNNELADSVEEKSAVAIGWNEMGDMSSLTTREHFKEEYSKAYPEHSQGRKNVNAGQIYRFVREIEVGDYALTYKKDSREIVYGIVSDPYEYNTDLFDEGYPQIRRVNWLGKISRDAFSASARNSMGSILTVFRLNNHLAEIHKVLSAPDEPIEVVDDEEDEEPPFYVEVTSKLNELIADLVSRLDPYDFQDLVAAVLRAMGFRADSVGPGPDRGVDIVAHPDALGFGRPRIKVQVKHRQDSIGSDQMRSFLGTLKSGDSGLYVSTGGFTNPAKQEAETSREPVTILNRDDFIQLLLEHYEALEPEFKSKVPLRRLWVPIEE